MLHQLIHHSKENLAKRLGHTSWDDFVTQTPRTALTCLQNELEVICEEACHQHLERYLREQAQAVKEANVPFTTLFFCETAYKKHLVDRYPVRL